MAERPQQEIEKYSYSCKLRYAYHSMLCILSAQWCLCYSAARKRDPKSLEVWNDLKNRILYSDEDLHVLNKPARLVVQGSKRISLAGLVKSGLAFAEGDDTK